ncbi:MAG: hypothetical protein Kow00121_51700 [Elainellaceae cyanobacterium]
MRDRLSRYLPMGLTLCLGVGFSIASALWVGRWEQLTQRSQFQQQIDNLATALQRSANRYNELLLAIGDFYAVSDNQVSQAAFGRYVQRSLLSYSGIQALEWAPRIADTERAAYEQQLLQLAPGHSLGITERNADDQLVRAGDRQEYVPVTYVAPWQGNELALGFDLASNQTRRSALERARDTGKSAATGRIKLVQETNQDQYSFLVFLPIYQEAAQTPRERRRSLQGYVLGVFRVADVVEEALNDLSYSVNFYIYDHSATSDQQFLGFYDAATQRLTTVVETTRASQHHPLCPTITACTHTLSFAQREWQIVFVPSRLDEQQYTSWGALAALIIGLLLTGSLLLYLSRSQAELDRTRELSDLKLRFFSMASHELRTPLSTILISVQSLDANRDTLSPQQKASAIDRIHTSAKRMTQLLSDILTLTRAEAGKLEFAPEIIDLEPFCIQLVDDVRSNLKTGQCLSFEFNSDYSQAFLDPKLLRSIAINLLSNAVKYSLEGGKIQFNVMSDAQFIHLQVIDQGIGIPPEAQKHIFEAFYRSDNVGSVPGTGLGLAVVKTCVDLHAGKIQVNSRLGEGTTITVLFPRIA